MDRDTFIKRADDHQFPFEADSYHQLFNSVEEFGSLFDEAKRGGVHFVNIFIQGMKYRLGVFINNAVHKALENQRQYLLTAQEREFGTGDDEFDAFRRMCLTHDWHYDYTDDGAVWRRGNDQQKKLEKIVADKGGKYKEYWENYALKKLK